MQIARMHWYANQMQSHCMHASGRNTHMQKFTSCMHTHACKFLLGITLRLENVEVILSFTEGLPRVVASKLKKHNQYSGYLATTSMTASFQPPPPLSMSTNMIFMRFISRWHYNDVTALQIAATVCLEDFLLFWFRVKQKLESQQQLRQASVYMEWVYVEGSNSSIMERSALSCIPYGIDEACIIA